MPSGFTSTTHQAIEPGIPRFTTFPYLECRGMSDAPIEKCEEYVEYATHCLVVAKSADGKSRELLKAMAAEWLRLADAANNNPAIIMNQSQ
jgi:hypothetical protein